MNWKKLSVYSIFLVLLLIPLMSVLVLAADTVTSGWEILGSFGTILTYIFGQPVSSDMTNGNAISAIIITIALWILVAVTFGDIIATFTTFSR